MYFRLCLRFGNKVIIYSFIYYLSIPAIARVIQPFVIMLHAIKTCYEYINYPKTTKILCSLGVCTVDLLRQRFLK